MIGFLSNSLHQFSENGFAAGVKSLINDGRLYALPHPEDLSDVTLDENDQIQAIIAALWTNGVVEDGVSEVRHIYKIAILS